MFIKVCAGKALSVMKVPMTVKHPFEKRQSSREKRRLVHQDAMRKELDKGDDYIGNRKPERDDSNPKRHDKRPSNRNFFAACSRARKVVFGAENCCFRLREDRKIHQPLAKRITQAPAAGSKARMALRKLSRAIGRLSRSRSVDLIAFPMTT